MSSTLTSPDRWELGLFPGVVLIHHLPGWDEWYREATRKFAHHGYLALSPNLYHREGHGTPEDVAAQVRAAGGVADEQAMGDVGGAMQYLRSLPTCNGKVGVFGTCSGGRQTVLVASRVAGFDAAIDCWGGRRGHGSGRVDGQAAGGADRPHARLGVSASRPVRRGGSGAHAGAGGRATRRR